MVTLSLGPDEMLLGFARDVITELARSNPRRKDMWLHNKFFELHGYQINAYKQTMSMKNVGVGMMEDRVRSAEKNLESAVNQHRVAEQHLASMKAMLEDAIRDREESISALHLPFLP